MTIAVVDYGIGNLGSVMKAFRHLGAPAILSGDIAELRRADVLVLPGDGAFASTMAEIEGRGLISVLREAVDQGRTLLGICIGMQLLFEESEEGGRGLGLLEGRVRRLRARRVPHMGWNALALTRPSKLLDGLDGADVYFAHSFAVEPVGPVGIAEVEHDGPLVAAIESGPLAGVQFHPERSGAAGARVLENALRWSRSA
jgi:imidazole glycerol-phosphate synthase subunit HisH